MGLVNQWKIISLTEDAQSALKRREYKLCEKLIKEARERLRDESHSSFPLDWDYCAKLAEIENKMWKATGKI